MCREKRPLHRTKKTPVAIVAKTKTDGIGQKNMRSEVLSLPAAFTFSRLRHKKRPLKRRTGKRNAHIKTEDTAYAYRICVCAFMAKNVHCIEQKKRLLQSSQNENGRQDADKSMRGKLCILPHLHSHVCAEYARRRGAQDKTVRKKRQRVSAFCRICVTKNV